MTLGEGGERGDGDHERRQQVGGSWCGIALTGCLALAPPDIAGKLSAAVIDALKAPDLATKLREQSMIVAASPPAETEAFIKKEIERWHSVIVRAGIKPD